MDCSDVSSFRRKPESRAHGEIPAQIDRRKDYDWRNLLPRRNAKRGRRKRKLLAVPLPLSANVGTSPSAQSMPTYRPTVPFTGEADLMLFGNHGEIPAFAGMTGFGE